MAKTYKPRRASETRWLESAHDYILDCFDHPDYADRWTILYCGDANTIKDSAGNVTHIFGMSHGEHCGGSFEMDRWQQAAYRYRNKHRRVRWLDIPEHMRERFAQRGLPIEESA